MAAYVLFLNHPCSFLKIELTRVVVASDYNSALTLLLRYPEPQGVQRPRMFVLDAIHLREHFNFDEASHIVFRWSQRSLPLTNRPSTPQSSFDTDVKDKRESPNTDFSIPKSASRPPRNLEDVLHNVTRGVHVQGESLGLNRAFRSAATEIRKGVRSIPSRHNSGHKPSPSIENTNDSTVVRIEDLKARNKLLAKMLEDAVGELWQQQNALSSMVSTDGEEIKTLTLAIAKVQLTQVYLDDSTLALPVDGANFKPGQQPTEATQQEDSKAETISEQHSAEPDVNNVISHEGQVEDSASRHQTQSTKSDTRGSALTHKARPSLEQSSFSFMLGQDEPSQSLRVAINPTKSPLRTRASYNHRQNVGFLFGDADDEEAPSSSKGRYGTAGDSNETAFQMGTLKDGKRG